MAASKNSVFEFLLNPTELNSMSETKPCYSCATVGSAWHAGARCLKQALCS